jgi:hypothetical protein
VLNIWKDFKVLSCFIQKWIQYPCLFGSQFLYLQAIIVSVLLILSSFQCCGPSFIFCLDYGILYPRRDRNFAVRKLYWFGFRVVGILQTFYSRAVIQRTIVDSPAFFEHGLAEKIVVCADTTRVPKISMRIRGIFVWRCLN